MTLRPIPAEQMKASQASPGDKGCRRIAIAATAHTTDEPDLPPACDLLPAALRQRMTHISETKGAATGDRREDLPPERREAPLIHDGPRVDGREFHASHSWLQREPSLAHRLTEQSANGAQKNDEAQSHQPPVW